jgi:hypothetical protein
MIDLSAETALSLADIPKRLPRGRRGRPVHLSTPLRWILQGAKGPNGEVVRLEAVRLGGRWITTIEALNRFTRRLTPDLEAAAKRSGRARPPAARRRAADRAGRELVKAGI